MTRAAQVLCAIFVLVLGGSALNTIFSPMSTGDAVGFNVTTAYGITNLRTLGAPTLSLAIITALGAYRKEWILVLPASLYFLFNGTARLLSVFVEGY